MCAPKNAKADRKDRRLKENQTGKRRVVVVMRERDGRTLPTVTRSEGEGVVLALENVSRTATMSADEASHWDALHAGWDVDRVNHSEIYSDNGKHTNMAESYFSRLRRMVTGQHHHVSAQYLYQYANQRRMAGRQPPHRQRHSGADRGQQRHGRTGQPDVEGLLAARGVTKPPPLARTFVNTTRLG